MRHPAQEVRGVPFPSAYWVSEGKVLAGEHPMMDEAQCEKRLKSLLDFGVRHIVDLTCEGEGRCYKRLWHEVARARGLTVTHKRFPIGDSRAPDRGLMVEILDYVDRCKERGAVYVHCMYGLGRTGTVVGCYLARHGIRKGREVIQMMKSLRAGTLREDWCSPEAPEQIDLVISWRPGE